MVVCDKCEFGYRNIRGYMECWRFNRRMDTRTTANTVVRELHAIAHNKYHDCVHYQGIPLKKRVFNFMFKLGTGTKRFLKRLL